MYLKKTVGGFAHSWCLGTTAEYAHRHLETFLSITNTLINSNENKETCELELIAYCIINDDVNCKCTKNGEPFRFSGKTTIS